MRRRRGGFERGLPRAGSFPPVRSPRRLSAVHAAPPRLGDAPALRARRRRREFGDAAAAAQHDDAIAKAEQFRHFARGDEHAEPLGGELAHARVNLALGADVDAARRLVEQQQARLAEHFLGEHDLLLIAARQRADRRSPARRADVERADRRAREPRLARRRHQEERRDRAHDRGDDIAADAVAQHQPAAAPIVGDEAEARGARGADRSEFAPARRRPRRRRSSAGARRRRRARSAARCGRRP